MLLLLLPLLWADLTHRPQILIPGALDPDHSKNLTCSVPWACEQGTPPIFSWLSAAPTSLGLRTTHSSVLIITPRPQDHGTNLTCQVKFPGAGVTTERTIQLNVTYASQNPRTGIFLGDGSVTHHLTPSEPYGSDVSQRSKELLLFLRTVAAASDALHCYSW
ncbi:hypothetical protein H8958_005043, partial [Nasalis larvatus]